jgi:hypothetical protein
MESNKQGFMQFAWRVTSVHMLSYFIAGVLALVFMDYGKQFASGILSAIMRPVDSPWVAMGPALQVIRGFVLALVLYPFKDVLSSKRGWLKLWLLIIGLSYFSTLGPTFGSFEGYLYTKAALSDHLLGIPEMLAYTFLFSFFVCYWYGKPKRIWNAIAGIGICLIFLMSIMGALASFGIIKN